MAFPRKQRRLHGEVSTGGSVRHAHCGFARSAVRQRSRAAQVPASSSSRCTRAGELPCASAAQGRADPGRTVQAGRVRRPRPLASRPRTAPVSRPWQQPRQCSRSSVTCPCPAVPEPPCFSPHAPRQSPAFETHRHRGCAPTPWDRGSARPDSPPHRRGSLPTRNRPTASSPPAGCRTGRLPIPIRSPVQGPATSGTWRTSRSPTRWCSLAPATAAAMTRPSESARNTRKAASRHRLEGRAT